MEPNEKEILNNPVTVLAALFGWKVMLGDPLADSQQLYELSNKLKTITIAAITTTTNGV